MMAIKATYDPIKTIEGMFNGSVTRIAYALKDPADYSGDTKTVLAECAKKFQDALDDCEIQLLDAKWFLEHQLQQNRSRRDAQRKEAGTSAKRKYNEVEGSQDHATTGEGIAKKARVEPAAQENSKAEQPIAQSEPKEAVENRSSGAVEKSHKQSSESEAKSKDSNVSQSVPEPIEEPKSDAKDHQQLAQETPKLPPSAPPMDLDLAKVTPETSPTAGNEVFNFESMFADPVADGNADTLKDDNDLTFEFTADDFGVVDGNADADPNSLDALLPGVQSYADQTDDNLLNINSANPITSNAPDANALPTFSNDFDLPTIGGPNIFDDYLDDENLGVTNTDTGANFEDNLDLNDTAFDLDFDSFS